MAITTPDEWWQAVNDNWNDLIKIIYCYLRTEEPAHEDVRNLTTKEIGITIMADILKAKTERDWHRLWRYFHWAWEAAPDTITIHSIPSWSVFCDLCSETWVFQPDEEVEPMRDKEETDSVVAANLMVNRAKTIAAMGMVERDYEGFNVTNPGIKKETFRVWRDEDNHIRCSCPEFTEKILTETRFRCEHILAVKFHLEPLDDTPSVPAESAGFTRAVQKTQDLFEVEKQRSREHLPPAKPDQDVWFVFEQIKSGVVRLAQLTRELEGSVFLLENKMRNDYRKPIPINAIKDPVAKTMDQLVTPKQLIAIRAISNSLNINSEAECLEQLRCKPEELSRIAASAFIDHLKAKVQG